jgi:hypothetical protein
MNIAPVGVMIRKEYITRGRMNEGPRIKGGSIEMRAVLFQFKFEEYDGFRIDR